MAWIIQKNPGNPMLQFTTQLREWAFSLLNRWSGGIDADQLMSDAIQKTGLSDWGDIPFQEPFRRIIESLQQEAGLSQQGIFVLTQHYSRLLKNLLLLVQDWKRHPEIHQIEIKAPIFILGFPRTGTTYLHSLLSLDPSFRTLRYWELLFPTPPPCPDTDSNDPRVKRAKQFVYFIDRISPKLATIHPLKADGVEECCFIFDHLFLDNINHLVFEIPSYIQWYDTHDPIPSYRFHRTMLQHYGLHYSFDRFVLKAPRHLFCLGALLAVYPDTCIVWTHRDPITALPSLCCLIETARRIVSDRIDCNQIGKNCLEFLEKDFHSGIQARDSHNQNQFFDVGCQQLSQNPIAVIRSIYEHFGLNYTNEFDANLKNFLQEKSTLRQKKHQYILSQYGLIPDQIREQLNGYYNRFEEVFGDQT